MGVNNKISIEYEARAMLTEEQYKNLINDFANLDSSRFFPQINFYYDTSDLFLTNHHMVLRIREIENISELTLKIKGKSGDTEISTFNIDKNKEIKHLISKEMEILLKQNSIVIDDLILVGTLKTERLETQMENYLLVIDKNYYNDKIDYNIEVESDSKEHAYYYLNPYLERYGAILDKKYISKSRRAILKN